MATTLHKLQTVAPRATGSPSTIHSVGVDRAAGVIRGVILAEAGPFKSEGRGRFDIASLRAIAAIIGKMRDGLKSRVQHSKIEDDRTEWFLGSFDNARLSLCDRGGSIVDCVRADLGFAPAAKVSPYGDLAAWLMARAAHNPGSCGVSLVLRSDREFEVDARGRRVLDAKGRPLPPRWLPVEVLSADIVDVGDATNALLAPARSTARLARVNRVRQIEGLPPLTANQAYALDLRAQRQRLADCLGRTFERATAPSAAKLEALVLQ